MYTPITSNQNHEISPLVRYNSASSDKYLNDSSRYSDNESDLRSVDCNNYESNYESDNQEALYTSTNTIKTPLVQLPNVQK